MRHRKKGRKFGRVRKVRVALMRSLLRALILKEKIKTTEAKAKEIRPKVEQLVTKAKDKSLAARRGILSILPDNSCAKKLQTVLAPKYLDRRGGYTRIIKLGARPSDRAPMALIEFV
ncbi:MAG: 50S ribosomal protein L17 [Candidatus Giovannonibacteria bacterium GW2011_GWB1_45_9b]|uniref:Large ribosomal subunit protein bL17 n=7 Tax=Candidatus Giovannoniibacteriota TaxID=1752738 RepID=A0A1F5WYU3_9BACT|nr:MAG: 50S ribosomal protein L17 [Candidatus Giovannonibacteria bacterium GW2011_GWC2_44_8]KKU04655.1 MAG: 50S ribosomal protein L17 [Candidatus Giovannonibacteria bacterium GW2011_GWA2_45_21]KKU16440.1 MAG: 50S ribosomal protein L17 [Candidatus Giovannonibacteria bacterium GW2011_GWB1_45_9b]OGF73369.1 MAG: 50S ribosomal protein L17 [Candidatus Giovannonibacteria bacterium RIFCSPHIGHO2_02_43_16]OGF80810.1 MAG: 50S ribosomal protein L17 [Candidatus Giovannonibacteria bacterium RIFCSPHIGHO2_12_4